MKRLGDPLDPRARPVDRLLARALAEALARPAAQQPCWPDPGQAGAVTRSLRGAEPVVAQRETDRLLDRLASVARGEAFLLQGGDCAETFAESTERHLRANLGALRRMADLFGSAVGLPVVTIARMAGQYAKPRSSPVDALGLPVYRGDIVNSPEPTPAARTPDPTRMLRAHAHAVRAMALVRAGDQAESPVPRANLVGAGIGPGPHASPVAETRPADEVYVSHELLLLDYERSVLWADTRGPHPRVASGLGHFLWVGERTRGLDGAHIAFAELLSNPVGLKIGPTTTPEQAVEYARRLDPDGTPGRLTLIARMGHDRVREVLPPIVEAVTASGHQVVWQCDPMHGNTRIAHNGFKTRDLAHVVDEVTGFVEVHRRLGTHPGGVHVEVTGEDVTECVGGSVAEADLPTRYQTACDPRLNAAQAVELARRAAAALTPREGPR
ncbi:3-deoxy-7-phosphoheptulonate synthase [Actinokineospora sp. G85]|uniref:3-deoxy-7-phosphoheptulonate synthase n=1 Tax=Actinokineospora sp. G85 TaxID=3406626 RepID=UPI003C741990